MTDAASCSIPSVIPVSRGRLDALDLGLGHPGRPHRPALIGPVDPGDRRDVVADGKLIDVGILEVRHAIVVVVASPGRSGWAGAQSHRRR